MKPLPATLFLLFSLTACTGVGGTGGGPGPGPGPSIPSGIFYVNEGVGASNVIGAFSTSQIAGGGQLAALAGSPVTVIGQNGATGAPFGIALAKAGAVLYVVNTNQPSVSAFTVNADGTIVPTAIASYTVGTSPSAVCVDPSSQFAAVVNTGDNTVQPYAINANGSLAAAPLATTNGLNSPSGCVYSSDSKYLYVSNDGGTGGISGFSVGALGALTKLPFSPYVAGHNLQGIVASSTTVYAADQMNNGVEALSISPSGDLVSPSFSGTAAGPIGLALTPNGKYLYVAAAGRQAVDGYAVSGPAVTALSGTPFATNANKTAMVSVNSAGTLLVALDELDRAVTLFAIKSDGTLGFAASNEYGFASTGNAMAVVAR